MPIIGPTKRKDLIKNLIKLGFYGPFAGGKHQFMRRGNITLRLPNPHKTDIGLELLIRILKQAHIKNSDWINL